MTYPGLKYTDKDLRSIAASIDLTAEFITLGKIPKEREQSQLLIQKFNSDTMLLMGYRALLNAFYAKPDSHFEVLLPLLQEAAEALPSYHQPLPYSSHQSQKQEAAPEDVAKSVSEGHFQRALSPRPEVESWINSTVSETFEILKEYSFRSISSGNQLAQLTIGLRFAYGQLLSAVNNYIAAPNETGMAGAQSFAASMMKDLRTALLIATISRILQYAPFEGILQDYFKALESSATSEQRLKIESLSARSQFDTLRRTLNIFQSDREQIFNALTSACLWDIFLENGLPNLREFLCSQSKLPVSNSYFVAGQISFVDFSSDPKDPPVLGTFDSHANQQCLATPSQNFKDQGFQLGGIALESRLQFFARGGLGLHIDENAKVFPAWDLRLIAEPRHINIEAARKVVQDTLAIERSKIGSLWISHPEVLSIISDREPTIVIFEGAQVTILGTCMPGSTTRNEFFSKVGACSVESVITRTSIEFVTPELWFARIIVASPAPPALPPKHVALTSEQQRQNERQEFRDSIQRTGQMNYREFVASLSAWNVVETNDGHGGHGSLKRVVNGSELRTGTWSKLRTPDRYINFARMYEILDAMRISVADYARALRGSR